MTLEQSNTAVAWIIQLQLIITDQYHTQERCHVIENGRGLWGIAVLTTIPAVTLGASKAKLWQKTLSLDLSNWINPIASLASPFRYSGMANRPPDHENSCVARRPPILVTPGMARIGGLSTQGATACPIGLPSWAAPVWPIGLPSWAGSACPIGLSVPGFLLRVPACYEGFPNGWGSLALSIQTSLSPRQAKADRSGGW